jgi:hypothetical protein
MAYLQPAGGEPISHDIITAMGQSLGLSIPSEDLQALADALRDQLASIERIDALDLADIAPAVQFDPRWHD